MTSLGNKIFAGTSTGEVFMTDDNGSNWTAMSNGISSPYISKLTTDGTNIYASGNVGGVFISTDQGMNWTAFNNGLENNPYVICTLPVGSDLYVGIGGAGVWKRPVSELTNIASLNACCNLLNIFPNPGNGKINLSINATEPISMVTASDLTGKVIAIYNLVGQNKTELQLDLSALAKGIYILNVQSSGGNLKGKILIE